MNWTSSHVSESKGVPSVCCAIKELSVYLDVCVKYIQIGQACAYSVLLIIRYIVSMTPRSAPSTTDGVPLTIYLVTSKWSDSNRRSMTAADHRGFLLRAILCGNVTMTQEALWYELKSSRMSSYFLQWEKIRYLIIPSQYHDTNTGWQNSLIAKFCVYQIINNTNN